MVRKAPTAMDPDNPAALAPEVIAEKVAEAAYYKAEKRGFAPGFEMEDWLEAEEEVKAAIAHVEYSEP